MFFFSRQQRLSADVDRLQREKQNLDQQVLSKDKSEGLEKQNDSDKRLLEARLKVSSVVIIVKISTLRTLLLHVQCASDGLVPCGSLV